jgi:hypothetical protein
MTSFDETYNPFVQTHMETAVTRLLVSTRQLLEALTEWSTGHMTDENVSMDGGRVDHLLVVR